MSFSVYLGKLPIWVTEDDIQVWLTTANLVADSIRVIRDPESGTDGIARIRACFLSDEK